MLVDVSLEKYILIAFVCFRLILAPIIIEGEEQRNAIGNLLRLSVSVPRADFKEVLSDVTVPLLEFHREEVCLASAGSPNSDN